MDHRIKATSYTHRRTPDLYPGVNLSNRLYQHQSSIPLLGGAMNTPAYRASLPGKSIGYVPCDVPTANPLAPFNIIPS